VIRFEIAACPSDAYSNRLQGRFAISGWRTKGPFSGGTLAGDHEIGSRLVAGCLVSRISFDRSGERLANPEQEVGKDAAESPGRDGGACPP